MDGVEFVEVDADVFGNGSIGRPGLGADRRDEAFGKHDGIRRRADLKFEYFSVPESNCERWRSNLTAQLQAAASVAAFGFGFGDVVQVRGWGRRILTPALGYP